MAAVWLKRSLVIPGTSFGCSSGFQLWTCWVSFMLEHGLPVLQLDLAQHMDSRDSPPVLHTQEVLLPFICHLPSFYCVQFVCRRSLSCFPVHPQGSWGQGTPFHGVLVSKSRWCRGVNCRPLQVGQGLWSSLPMWWFSSGLPDRKVVFSSMLDALGSDHYYQTLWGSLQVSAVLLIEEGGEVGASLLFVWMK